jgi:DNA invertase Pin-like site-specific DNA recombinase
MEKNLAALFETVKAAVRAGAFPAADPDLLEVVRGWMEPIRTLQKDFKISLDVQQCFLYALKQSERGGEKAMQEYVAYYRVSTKAQGASGLGLEAQRTAVESFANQNGGAIVREFTEVESGNRTDRPELAAALAFAKRSGAVLLVAKIDRLARNVAFLSGLMQSGVNFVACDNPHANKFTVHILAAVAEFEREAISTRTKAALKQAKARGVALGSARPGHWEGKEEARRAGAAKGCKAAAKAISTAAREAYKDLEPMIQAWRQEGLSLGKIADRLNGEGYKTRRGAKFTAVQVSDILKRAGE